MSVTPSIHLQKALTNNASLTLEVGFGYYESAKRHLSQICQYAASQIPISPEYPHPSIYSCQVTAIICLDELSYLLIMGQRCNLHSSDPS